jgi:ankyrin repeat protein
MPKSQGSNFNDIISNYFGRVAHQCKELTLFPLKKVILPLAVFQGFNPPITTLINYGLDVNATDFHGNSLLHHAVIAGNMPLINHLLENNIDINIENKTGMTPLALAIKEADQALVILLFKHGANIFNEQDSGINFEKHNYNYENYVYCMKQLQKYIESLFSSKVKVYDKDISQIEKELIIARIDNTLKHASEEQRKIHIHTILNHLSSKEVSEAIAKDIGEIIVKYDIEQNNIESAEANLLGLKGYFTSDDFND